MSRSLLELNLCRQWFDAVSFALEKADHACNESLKKLFFFFLNEPSGIISALLQERRGPGRGGRNIRGERSAKMWMEFSNVRKELSW